MYGVLLIAVLVITGGAVAFIGDRLGTKIGKKRLSIFGLRPRHTSIVITIFTGIFITTMTFGVMAAVSENVRTALFGMEELRQDMIATRNNLDKVTSELITAQDAQERAAEDLKNSRAEITALEEKEARLTAESERLEAGNLALEAEKEEMLGLNEQISAQNKVLDKKNTTLAERNTILIADNVALEKRTSELRDGLISMREGDIIFQAGEVVAGGIIKGGRRAEETAADLASLARAASRNAAARKGTNDGDADIWIYPPEYENALQEISKSPQDVAVRIVAAGNLLKNEPIRTSLELYPNAIVYHGGELVLSKIYQLPGGDGATVEQTVMGFLKEVNQAATVKGILPDPIRKSVGVMDSNDYYEFVQTLIPIKGKVIISAYADSDTNTLGPLRLMMRFEELTGFGERISELLGR